VTQLVEHNAARPAAALVEQPKPSRHMVVARAAAALFMASFTFASCGSDEPPLREAVPTSTSGSQAPTEEPKGFPTAVFASLMETPVPKEMAAQLQEVLEDMAIDGGLTATAMTPEGTWSGASGSADGVRDLQVDDQFFIASITKSVVAAQVMLMVEARELSLDDLAADYLPVDLDFDTNHATIRQLLDQQSGLPDYFPKLWDDLDTDRKRRWTPAEVLEVAGDDRSPVGETFQYADTNYVLLGLVIEHVRGRSVAQVLRDGALAVDGTERLVYQPDEKPTEPMAMPNGEPHAALERGDGYLPSIASATAGGPAAAIASDSPSLARWWRSLCAGEIVSQASLTQMSTLQQAPAADGSPMSGGYGLGLYNVTYPYAHAIGHTGADIGFMSFAACLPESGSVLVVLLNHHVDIDVFARPLVDAVNSL
jgi:D-alanyl-D-alanine carboxypeptidase